MSFNGGQIDGPAYVIGQYPNGGITYGSSNGGVVTLASITRRDVEHRDAQRVGQGKGTTGNGLWQVYRSATNLTTTTPALPSGAVGWQAVLEQHRRNVPVEHHPELEHQGLFLERRRVRHRRLLQPHPAAEQEGVRFSNQKEGYSATVIWSVGTMVGASSYHSGGVNVGMLDGSVRFVKDSVNLATWGAIATKAGGEVVSADSL